VSPEPAVCDPAASVEVVPVEVIPAEPVAPMPPAETALVAEISAPDLGPVLPSVDEGEARTATRVDVSTRRHAYEPSRETTIAPPPETPAAVTDSGPLPIWPASPAPPTVPMVPVAPTSPSTATSSGTTASGTGQHHESYGDLAILHAGPAIVFGQVGGASTSSLAGHVIGGADDPGSTPA
jgi:hypothetical protein